MCVSVTLNLWDTQVPYRVVVLLFLLGAVSDPLARRLQGVTELGDSVVSLISTGGFEDPRTQSPVLTLTLALTSVRDTDRSLRGWCAWSLGDSAWWLQATVAERMLLPRRGLSHPSRGSRVGSVSD